MPGDTMTLEQTTTSPERAEGADARHPAEAVRWSIPLCDIAVDDAIAAAVDDVVRSGWWSMGPRVEELERRFAEFCGAEFALAVSSGSAALHLALLAVGCTDGDEVILPSLNFVAAANSIAHTGATPVFCDVVGEDDLNLDPAHVEALVGPRTRAIVAMHYAGHPCDLGSLRSIARRHGLMLVEDAAHAVGAYVDGRSCGTIGDIGCFSFFSNKNLPAGEGGMVVTDDPVLVQRVRLLRSHGMTTLTWDRHQGHAGSYDVVARGFNYRLDEIRAAIALVELDRLLEGNAARARLVARYRERFEGLPWLPMPFARVAPTAIAADHLAVVLLSTPQRRDAVRAALTARGIQTSIHYPPIHLFTEYRDPRSRPLARTEAIAGRVLTLPLYPAMTSADVDAVADAVIAG
jgi:dTDP-4-amino-4,6-dideoxygalactose transaminase